MQETKNEQETMVKKKKKQEQAGTLIKYRFQAEQIQRTK